MKHRDEHSGLEREIGAAAREAGADLSAADAELLATHLRMVLAANERLNLTRIDTPSAAIRLHVADSLAAVRDLAPAPSGCLVDLGSGAGYPGIPLGVASQRGTTLVESVGKKAEFLKECVAALGLSDRVAVFAGRVESLGRDRPGAFSAAVARAVSSLPSLVELAAPLLSTGGRFVALKGRPDAIEIERGDSASEEVGLERVATRRFVLPGGDEHRTIIVYEKRGESSIALPRRDGLAQRRPLA